MKSAFLVLLLLTLSGLSRESLGIAVEQTTSSKVVSSIHLEESLRQTLECTPGPVNVDASFSGRVRHCLPDRNGKSMTILASNGCIFYSYLIFFCEKPENLNATFRETKKCVKNEVPVCGDVVAEDKVGRCIVKSIRECNQGVIVQEFLF